MRPMPETCVASVMTMPAPPAARAPRCWTCQSFPRPSLALYWHIQATTMRLRAVTERKLIGRNSKGVDMQMGYPEWTGVRAGGNQTLSRFASTNKSAVTDAAARIGAKREYSVHPVLGV